MEEKQVFFLVVIVVLNQFVHGDSLNGEGAIGCSRLINLCRYDEFCNAAEFYPFGKCKRRIFKKNFSHIKDQGQKFAENKGLPVRSIPSSAEDTFNNKYDMTYFKKDGSVKYPKNEKSFLLLKKNFKRPAFEISFIRKKRKRKRVFNAQAIKNGRMATNDNDKKYDMTFLSENFSPDLLKHDELSGNNINDKGTSLDEPGGDGKSVLLDTKDSDKVNRKFEKKHVDDGFASSLLSSKKENREVKFEKARNENIFHDQGLNEFEKSNQKEVRKSTNVSNNDESLDLEIEMKPLTENDKKYFDVDKSKLSLIPKTPSSDSGSPQKIEHVQVNSPSKKTKVGVLVAGKVGEIKADIIQNNSPDATYENVKDFFKSQQVSSIVDAPLAEQKDKAKMYDIQQKHDNENNIKRSTIPTPYVHPGLISLYVKERLNPESANNLLRALQDYLWGIDNEKTTITSITADDYKVVFHLLNNSSTDGSKFSKIVDRINNDQSLKDNIKKAVGMTVLSASLDSKDGDIVDRYDDKDDDHQFVMTLLIVAGCISALLLACVCIFIILKRTREKKSPKWVSKQDGQETASDYQSLWRHLRQATWDSPIQTTSVNHSDDGSIKETLHNKGIQPKYSWSEEPVDTKMDISTGHAILDYMEDHRQNENRLSDEWEELCAYVADPNACDVGKDAKNIKKNRYSDVLPYDHNRVKLRETSNATGSDYINASYIIDDDPRYPTYIAAQGPLASTVADFWQMIWERGVVVIVMLTKLADLGMPQCHRYWPQKGHQDYHIYQVNLISEHIWCDDYLVRSFYLKNIRTGETRTVTQFHFLSWPHLGLPNSTKSILDFRRKVLKCFRNQSSPVVVHCSGGIDRTGTYILIDMVLGKMTRGTKEIDLAATLEHLRDQRPQMVKTKDQFEFSLIAVADEVNAILQVLNKH